jgi:hypothetical protein
MNYESFVIRSEKLSPKQFLNLSEKDKEQIESTKIIPPEIGKRHSGGIEVTYKLPIYKIPHGK